MQGYIYIITNKAFKQYDTETKKCVKIGSTFIPVDRYFNYLTYAPESWEYIKVYKIINSIFKNCFAIDHNFKNTSNLNRILLDGGEEWYSISSPLEVEQQLKEWNVIFEDITTSIILKRPNNFRKNIIKEDFERKDKYLYHYQQEIVNNWNFSTGILCLATGLGKTVIACEMLNKFFTRFPKKLVIWHTKRKDILETQEIEVIVPFISIIGKEPTENIIKGKNLIICNSARLNTLLNLIRPDLIITDECHDITADNTFNLLHKQKQKGCILIGLSATPLKNNKKSYNRIYELYNNNFIASITLLEAIDKDYLVPLIFKWIQVNTNKVKSDLLIEIMKEDVIKYLTNCNGKSICWTDTIESCDKWYSKLEHLNVFKSHSKCDNKCNQIKKFIKEDYGTLICVDRFRQGSDDKRLSLGINLSNVKDRESHVEIQMIGRLLRKHQDKTEATFVDICEIDDEQDKINKLAIKIIQYCLEIDPDFIKYKMELIDNQINIIGTKNKILISCNLQGIIDNKEEYQQTFDEIKSKYKKRFNFTLNDLMNILITNDIKNNTEYQIFRETYTQIELPVNIQFIFPDFRWELVNDTHSLYTKEECIQRIKEIYEEYYDEINKLKYNNDIHSFLLSKDNCFPTTIFWKYYGCDKTQFIIFK